MTQKILVIVPLLFLSPLGCGSSEPAGPRSATEFEAQMDNLESQIKSSAPAAKPDLKNKTLRKRRS